jgi:hypothetical protein
MAGRRGLRGLCFFVPRRNTLLIMGTRTMCTAAWREHFGESRAE